MPQNQKKSKMSKKSRAALKGRFKYGMCPTESDYSDWMDSFVHKDDPADESESTQEVYNVGAVPRGTRRKVSHGLKRFPCVSVYEKGDGMLKKLDGVTVMLIGTTAVEIVPLADVNAMVVVLN